MARCRRGSYFVLDADHGVHGFVAQTSAAWDHIWGGTQMINFINGLLRLRRGPWEMVATILIALGVFMLMQPFSMFLFTYSFLVTLTGTVMFIIVSHFPE